MASEVHTIDDDLWDELVEVTHGAVTPCYQCGVCTAICPWGFVRDEGFSVRTILRHAQLGLLDSVQSFWTCTACAQCEALCPRGVPIAEVIRGFRHLLWDHRRVPEGLASVLWSVYWNNNPWSQPPSHRSHWAKDLTLPLFDPQRHEYLLYVGCTPSYDRRAQRVARSLAHIFQTMQVSFGVLGDDEPCCGEAVFSLGHQPYFEEIAENAAQVFRQKGVRKLVTISPHCFDVFLNHYPPVHGGFEPFHYTQVLSNLAQDDCFVSAPPRKLKVTFQDPCFLSRWNRGHEPPRQALSAVPGLTLVEMENNGPEAMCCGGGGGRMWMETSVNERFSNLRVREAATTGAEILATACPFCITCLEDSLKANDMRDLRVMDVAEVWALALSEDG